MINAEMNRKLTEIGAGTEAGAVLRRYWQPVALVDEFDGPRPVRPVTLLGEKLVAFRNEDGTYGLIDRHCPHRGADLCYGRLEDGGIRCPFHGWKFDTDGQCLETPAEPEESQLASRIKTTAYPVAVRNGILFGYLGTGEPPAFPKLDCFTAPDSHTFAFKGLIESNWLQALEVGIDPAHASFLHRYLEDDDPADAYGKQFRDYVGDTDIPMTRILRDFPRPKIDVETTDYGLRIMALRDLDGQAMHVRVTNQVFPQAITIPMSNEMTITQWHVPIDDENCYWYAIFTSFGNTVDKVKMRQQREALYIMPDYIPKVGKQNGYGYDPVEQKMRTYTGMGDDINVHDQWAVESPGPIQDRTKEHLGQTDVAIAAYRRLLLRAIKTVAKGEGTLPILDTPGGPGAIKGPIAIDTLAPHDTWRSAWLASEQKRREAAPWYLGTDSIAAE
ncbi:MAG: ring-hydroxylating oxygenase subunit alpha [Rhodospirillaceae bacterium]|mgnify:FL=1|jgi:phenylpropionate dioxygenase-like ring-hydroxylating dioxygenase large terminal subunit|uniref:Rieske 2Fe-2S domain-containing protein n=1 Tax=Hwanghaeella sp. 1Z406 TaxID=3402811 RepID=UPI000C3581E3|nr:ring-hydroxylating oxygenase subunit alpha [Rhodospirillales bacterium]MAX48393.1 ring-hydroxylating oxygenase subunit alpha [Rhodospirillaceae bacterium]|tara:strand:- start:26315 stop:27649 length:1335 start_codon:yes stop_codon:yes gene_type:complete